MGPALSGASPRPAEAEARLLARIRAEDTAALEVLYQRHHGSVLAMAIRRGCPPEEAEDVAHEVFMALWKRPPASGQARLSTWLYRVTANKVASLHRKRRVRRWFAQLSGHEPEAFEANAPLEARDAVREVLARMSPKKREVLVLFEIEDRSGGEIAELLDCRENTVWTRLHHARREFRAIAESLGVDGERTEG